MSAVRSVSASAIGPPAGDGRHYRPPRRRDSIVACDSTPGCTNHESIDHPDGRPRVGDRRRGDVGGFGVGSDLTWQAFAGIGYGFNPRWSVTAGYRALGVDFQRSWFELDVIMHGPVVGVGLRF